MVAALQNRFVQTVVAFVVAGVATACTNFGPPVCEQGGGYDHCSSCAQDTDCITASELGEVCAQDAQCWPPDKLRTVVVGWTIGGQPANAMTCAGLPTEVGVEFEAPALVQSLADDNPISTPSVPCTAGMVVQTQVPADLTNIRIGGDDQLLGESCRSTNGYAQPCAGQSTTTYVFNLPCVQDTAAGDVCSLGTYVPAPDVETVNVMWTVNGQPASASSCAGVSNLSLQVGNVSLPAWLRYSAPVQCANGAFTASNVATDLQTVFMYDGLAHLIGSAALVNGSATLDLTP
jgi:hypothetical protein